MNKKVIISIVAIVVLALVVLAVIYAPSITGTVLRMHPKPPH